MYFVNVHGTILRTLSISEKQIVVSFKLDSCTNVIFPTKQVSILFETERIADNLDQALEIIEQKMHCEIVLNIRLPKIDRVYYGMLHTI